MAARWPSVRTLWHQRYGHLNVRYLSQLAWEELVLGLPKIQIQNLEFVMHVRLGSNIAHLSPVAIYGELLKYFSLFMSIFAGLKPLLLSWVQNSVVERRNRTIIEIALSMLEHRHVPKQFWAEAVNTAVYLLNQSPTVAVKGKTPEEAWSSRKPRISHLKVFGSLSFVGILDVSHTKLNAKSQKLMLAGYSSLHKAYRLIDVETSHLIYSRDVVFDEQRGPFMPISLVPNPADQPMMAHDMGVRLPLGPPDGRAPVAPVIPVIPV